MRKHWNDKVNKSAYKWVLDDAITTKRYTAEELEYAYINDIADKTPSKINRTIEKAYYRGMLAGIKVADEMRDPIYPAAI